MATRTILLNPGPVTMTPRVRAALTAGDWCHREPEFADLVRDINARLASVYPELAGDYQAVTLAGSGTSAVEAMLASFAPDDRTTLVVANGVYGERMARILAAHGKPARVVTHAWTAAIDLIAITRELDADPAVSHVAVVHHETTTGRLNELAPLGRLCRERGLPMLVDAVSSFGAEAIDAAGWNVAALAGTANKCLHGVAGLSFVLARRGAWSEPPRRPGSVYLDLRAYHTAQHGDGFSPFTLPPQIAHALREALAEFAEEGGWQARRRTYLERAARIGAILEGAGVQRLLPAGESSAVLHAWRLPANLGYATLHDRLKARGFVIYAGQGDLAREIFRLSPMGDITAADLDRLCAALAEILAAPTTKASR